MAGQAILVAWAVPPFFLVLSRAEKAADATVPAPLLFFGPTRSDGLCCTKLSSQRLVKVVFGNAPLLQARVDEGYGWSLVLQLLFLIRIDRRMWMLTRNESFVVRDLRWVLLLWM